MPFCWSEDNIISRAIWRAGDGPRAVGDPMHVETSFVLCTGQTYAFDGRSHPCPGRHAGPVHEGEGEPETFDFTRSAWTRHGFRIKVIVGPPIVVAHSRVWRTEEDRSYAV